MDRSLTNTQYIDGRRASRLLGAFLISYQKLRQQGDDGLLAQNERLSAAYRRGDLTGLVLAAAFDVICNAEYLHGRIVSNRWIYCHRHGESPTAYFSFLKQCPACCLDKGLEKRLAGAQHKPTSHHIGEITTVACALLLQFVAAANAEPFAVATITKQSHDADAIGFRDDLLVLFEIKASPMVSLPVVTVLGEALRREVDGTLAEYEQHSLVDMTIDGREFGLAIPHQGWSIPLGLRADGWPYEPLIEFFSEPDNCAKFLSAWLELYEAYRVPKIQRRGRTAALAYLVNGWGDEIDSNKTKPGLGRTDDIKKGTYQLLKFGAYYRDDNASTPVRGALVANLDPLFLRGDYIDAIADVRWGHQYDFRLEEGEYRIPEKSLRHMYDGILTFNDPLINDPLLASLFDLPAVDAALVAGDLDEFLSKWIAEGPDEVRAEVADGTLTPRAAAKRPS